MTVITNTKYLDTLYTPIKQKTELFYDSLTANQKESILNQVSSLKDCPSLCKDYALHPLKDFKGVGYFNEFKQIIRQEYKKSLIHV